MNIRPALQTDLGKIVDIYNQAVAMAFKTADTEPWVAAEKQDWFNAHTENEYPVYVAELAGQVVGWLSVSAYRAGRKALRYTKEVSYYVDHNHWGRGIANALLAHAIAEATHIKAKNYIAILLDSNERSIKLLGKNGFQQWGYLPAVADFDGVVCGHLYYGFATGYESPTA